jgi:Leucine-rich repeat (LRR) protein
VACRVKMPHLAIRAKLASSNYCDVIEEDLTFFKNLTHLDLSDNNVHIHQLTNLVSLEELDLQ